MLNGYLDKIAYMQPFIHSYNRYRTVVWLLTSGSVVTSWTVSLVSSKIQGTPSKPVSPRFIQLAPRGWNGPWFVNGPLRWRTSIGCSTWIFTQLLLYLHQQPPTWTMTIMAVFWYKFGLSAGNKGVLESPRPPGSSSACVVWSTGCQGCQNGYLVSIIGRCHRFRCCSDSEIELNK